MNHIIQPRNTEKNKWNLRWLRINNIHWKIIQGHILDVIDQIEDESIDCIVTSPPYWGLRDYDIESVIWKNEEISNCDHEWGEEIKSANYNYEDKIKDGKWDGGKQKKVSVVTSNFCINKFCNAWKGQLGLEPTFILFIQHLIQIFEALKPKLKKGGSLWVNLGDTYSGNSSIASKGGRAGFGNEREGMIKHGGIKEKSLIGIPDRFKIAMIDQGWICRNEIIWHKPSTMPSSAKDRFTVDFEKFFFFTKNKKYYFKQQFESMNIEENQYRRNLRKNKNYNTKKYGQTVYSKSRKHQIGQYADGHSGYFNKDGSLRGDMVKGRNMRTTWVINSKGYKDAHFAVFPEKLIEVPIDACCPEKTEDGKRGVVLDPFSGSGTTGVVTLKQNKAYIGIEINPEYIKMSEKRISRYNVEPVEYWFGEE